MRNLLSLIFFVSFFVPAKAQIDYALFRDSATLKAEDSGKLSLSIDNLNYLRNYEYFGDIPLSYTLLGYQFISQLKYQLNEAFSLKGGIFLRREFGIDGFTDVVPVLTAKYQKRSFTLNLGTLEGSLNHRFIEPIYDVESIISDRIEQGVQAIINRKKFWLDWYIDWEKAIKLNSSHPEEFTTGFSIRKKIFQNDRIDIELPAQALVAHKGGQIDSSNTPVESLLNTAVGAAISFNNPGAFIKAIKTQHFFAYYRDISGTKAQLFNEGTGLYSALIFKSRLNIDLDIRYWKGDSFHGPRGGALYSSISEKIRGYGEQKRELLFVSFIYDKQLFSNVWLDLRVEPYYDLKNRFTEYAYSVFLRFNKDFLLKRIK